MLILQEHSVCISICQLLSHILALTCTKPHPQLALWCEHSHIGQCLNSWHMTFWNYLVQTIVCSTLSFLLSIIGSTTLKVAMARTLHIHVHVCNTLGKLNYLRASKLVKFLTYISYSQKIWQGIKFGGLVLHLCDHHIKIRQYFMLAYIRMVILTETPTLKSTNIFSMAILGSIAKFNSR